MTANRYRGRCHDCKETVEAEAGCVGGKTAEGGWFIRCMPCQNLVLEERAKAKAEKVAAARAYRKVPNWFDQPLEDEGIEHDDVIRRFMESRKGQGQ